MTKDEALRLALEALKTIDEAMPFPVAKLAIKECKSALEAKDEPLAYLQPTASPDNACYNPSQRTWVGLTDEEKQEWIDAMPSPPQPRHFMVLVNAIESELKEKNCG